MANVKPGGWELLKSCCKVLWILLTKIFREPVFRNDLPAALGWNVGSGQPKQQKVTIWTKEAICLRYTDQVKAPDKEEKMKLAQRGKKSSSILMKMLTIFIPQYYC